MENEKEITQEQLLKTATKKGFTQGMTAGLFICAIILCISYIASQLIPVGSSKSAIASIDNSETEEESKTVVNDEVVKKLQLLEESIDEYYLKEADAQEVENSIYKGLVAGLGDPYSTYYSKEELEEVYDSSAGIYYGIGAYIALDETTGGGQITKVMPGTPAEEAGLHDNDIIVAVDDENVLGLTLSEIVSKVKGPENTQVMLTIYREGEREYLEIPVTRKKIESPTVTYEMYENNIAYIQITEFDAVTTEQFREKLNQAKTEGMKGLILDLRDNPGGNLSDVVDISEELLPKGLIVYTEDRNGKRTEYKCDGKNEIQVPMVVLVNGNSASAAEILAGAIKDYNKGTILGTTTFGKGIVQRIFGFTDGSAIKLTVSNYYTPNGNNIHEVGIEPDETLEFDYDKYLEDKSDNQLERAKEILQNQQ
ncbi:MAG: S41 family peptidase [Lachnospiraceae bacterium]|nr:S41 family peptidase [Lachnospiraceae bacterium]